MKNIFYISFYIKKIPTQTCSLILKKTSTSMWLHAKLNGVIFIFQCFLQYIINN